MVNLRSPRLHAFVVGVGDYRHLGLGAVKPSKFLTGLAPLTTTTPAAKRIARWLETQYRNDGCKLGSIELLLSPTESVKRADGSDVAIDEATMPNVDAAFKRWFDRCNAQKGNIAFFYFAGHGISTISQFLLPADFGNPDFLDDWKNCVDFTGMKGGMAKCAAQTQVFFVDACRDAPIAALLQKNPHGEPLVTSTFQDKVGLSAAYYASSEGRQAFGRDGEETFFCKALIMCLEGVAARKAGPKWRIDAASLGFALNSVMDAMAATENLPLTSECHIQMPVPLHFPDDGAVVVKVGCEPEAVRAEAAILVAQGADVLASPAGEPRPWMGRVKAGEAKIEVTFANYRPEIIVDQMTPPTYPFEVER
jgi:hypothetical protein